VPWLADWSGGSLTALAAEQRGRSASADRGMVAQLRRSGARRAGRRGAAPTRTCAPPACASWKRARNSAIAGSLLYPQQQQVTGEVLRTGTEASSGPDSALTAYNIGFGVGWEIDFWGKFRRSIEAADAGYFASIAQYDDLQVLIAAQVGPSMRDPHPRVAFDDRPRERRAAEAQPGDHRTAVQDGNDSELDVQQAKSQYLSTLATIPQLEGSLRQTQNALSACCSPARRDRCRKWRQAGSAFRSPNWRSSPTCRRDAAPPPGRAGGRDATGGAVGADRRQRGRALPVDRAARFARRLDHVAVRGARNSSTGRSAPAWSGTSSTTAA
jgi:hypothetical protein